ncbi:MAG: septum formation initiator family protein [Andreesenia angusta]|nr:septum formation initiator family protein [Andreesenia angusta]
MKEKKKAKKKRRRRFDLIDYIRKTSKITFIFMFLTAYLFLKIIGQQMTISGLKAEGKSINKDIKNLNKEVKELTRKIENKADIVFIERIARDDLNMLRPGEIMYEIEE